MALWTEVDHGESPVPEGDPPVRVDPQTAVVRAPVLERGGHVTGLATELLSAGPSSRIEQTGDAAHVQ
jgi:hypothetical protein